MTEQTFCFCFSSKPTTRTKTKKVRGSIAKHDAQDLLMNSGMVTVEEIDNTNTAIMRSNDMASTRLFFDSRFGPVR